MLIICRNRSAVHLHHRTNTPHGILAHTKAGEFLRVRRRSNSGRTVLVIIIVVIIVANRSQVNLHCTDLRLSIGFRVEHFGHIGENHLFIPTRAHDDAGIGHDIYPALLRSTTHNHGHITSAPHAAE